MANREENLKKINEQLEQLSDEELDNVAGGSYMPDSPKGRPDPYNPGPYNPDPFAPKRPAPGPILYK